MLDDKNPTVRARAAFALGGLDKAAADAAPRLRELLRDRDRGVRRFAIYALSHVGGDSRLTVLAISREFKNEDGYTRRAAAATLGSFGEKAAPAIPMLIEALVHNDDGLPEATLGGSGRSPSRPSSEPWKPDKRSAPRP